MDLNNMLLRNARRILGFIHFFTGLWFLLVALANTHLLVDAPAYYVVLLGGAIGLTLYGAWFLIRPGKRPNS